MRYACTLVTLTLLACGEPKLPDRPVDMQFRVSVEHLENSCGDTGNLKPEEGYTAIVDVFMRSNGRVNLGNDSAYISGRSVYEDIVLKDGRIDHKLKAESGPGTTLEHALKGVVTPENMDVTQTVHDRNWSNGSDCARKTRLHGAARPLLDPDALDGTYKVLVEDWGFACPGDPPRQKQSEGTVLLEVDQYMAGRINYTLNGQLAWGSGPPGGDGLLEWSGTMFIGGFFELQASVKGVFRPDDVDLTLEWGMGDDGGTLGCNDLLFIKGAKRIPKAASVDNDYRAAIVMSGGCGLAAETTESTVQLTVQADGKVALVDPYLGVHATLRDNALSYVAGSEAEGEMLTLSGSAAPPLLDYSVEYKAETSPGSWCAATYTASGHARFVFE